MTPRLRRAFAGMAVILALGGTGCAGERTYRGVYFLNFENSLLQVEGGGQALCVNSPELLSRLGSEGESVRAQVVVRGRLTSRNARGGLGACKGVLQVTEVIDVARVTRRPE